MSAEVKATKRAAEQVVAKALALQPHLKALLAALDDLMDHRPARKRRPR